VPARIDQVDGVAVAVQRRDHIAPVVRHLQFDHRHHRAQDGRAASEEFLDTGAVDGCDEADFRRPS
jgi:hypothetical protein